MEEIEVEVWATVPKAGMGGDSQKACVQFWKALTPTTSTHRYTMSEPHGKANYLVTSLDHGDH